MDKQKVVLAERGCKLPIRVSSRIPFEQPASSQVLLVIKEGDRSLSTENDLLFNLLLPAANQTPVTTAATVREVVVCLTVSTAGLLSIEARDAADDAWKVASSARLACSSGQLEKPSFEQLSSSLKEKKDFAENMQQLRRKATAALHLLDLVHRLVASKRVLLVIDEQLQAELCTSLTQLSSLADSEGIPHQALLDRIDQQSQAVLAVLEAKALEQQRTQNPLYPSAANSVIDKIEAIRSRDPHRDPSLPFHGILEDLVTMEDLDGLFGGSSSPFLSGSHIDSRL